MSEEEDLQFEEAEYEEGELTESDCRFCMQPIAGSYYLHDQLAICAPCHQRVADRSGWSNLLRALSFGLIATLIGAAIDFGMATLTGSSWGIVALLVAFIVGVAVRIGAPMGGLGIQILAGLLVYLAVGLSISGQALKAVLNGELEAEPAATTSVAPSATPTPLPAVTPAESPTTPALETEPQVSGSRSLVFLVVLVGGLALGGPILMGMESPLLFLIYGYAIYWAASMNKRVEVQGPLETSAGESDDGQLPQV